jgi:hypothetical protein
MSNGPVRTAQFSSQERMSPQDAFDGQEANTKTRKHENTKTRNDENAKKSGFALTERFSCFRSFVFS